VQTSDLDAFPWEIDAHTARQAMLTGQELSLAGYLLDASRGTNLLADLADPPNEGAPKLRLDPSSKDSGGCRVDDYEDQCDGTAHQLEEGVKRGSSRLVGWYLREVSDVLRLAADTLSTEGQSEWRLRFGRRRRGRPYRPEETEQQSIALTLKFAKARGQNLKRPIWELGQKLGVSRATIYRRMQRPSRSRKKP
jgi:predicted DNA-binding transcriptional regulator AlpA